MNGYRFEVHRKSLLEKNSTEPSLPEAWWNEEETRWEISLSSVLDVLILAARENSLICIQQGERNNPILCIEDA